MTRDVVSYVTSFVVFDTFSGFHVLLATRKIIVVQDSCLSFRQTGGTPEPSFYPEIMSHLQALRVSIVRCEQLSCGVRVYRV